jgi:hypothetical protein
MSMLAATRTDTPMLRTRLATHRSVRRLLRPLMDKSCHG